MARSSNAEFDPQGFGEVVRDIETLYARLEAGSYDLNNGAGTVNSGTSDGDHGAFGEVAANPGAIGALSGSATMGGDLTGYFPNPTIAKLQGQTLTLTAASSGHFLRYSGSEWANSVIQLSDLPIYNSATAYFFDGVGGNARGANAVDWQMFRTAVTQVASGSYSVVLGGKQNTASGLNSLAGGFGNTASQAYATAIGRGNTASGDTSFAIGYSNASSGDSSYAFGFNNSVAGSGGASICVAIGAGNSVDNGTYALGASNANSTATSHGTTLIGSSNAGPGYAFGYNNAFSSTSDEMFAVGYSNVGGAGGGHHFCGAIGWIMDSRHDYSIGIGYNGTTTATNQLYLAFTGGIKGTFPTIDGTAASLTVNNGTATVLSGNTASITLDTNGITLAWTGLLSASVDNVVTNKVKVLIGGVYYYLLATTSAA